MIERSSVSPVRHEPTAIDSLGQSAYASSYGGVAIAADGTFDVYLTQLDSSVEASLQAADPTSTIRFHTTRRSEQALETIHARLQALSSNWYSQGIIIGRFWPDFETGTEMVGVLNSTPSVADAITSAFSAGDITVYSMTPSQMPIAAADRVDDYSPWNGGDGIVDRADRDGCTSGFGVTINGKSQLITAGHCFRMNHTIQNDRCTGVDQNGCTGYYGNDSMIGNIVDRPQDWNGLDVEVIDASGSQYIWTSYLGNPVRHNVVGFSRNYIGDTVCQSGSYSGEICNIKIDSLDNCITLNWYGVSPTRRVCDQAHGSNGSTYISNEEGDSGGPVYVYDANNNVVARGIDSASTGAPVPCAYNTWDTCSNDIFYTAMPPILAHYNATMNT